MHTVSAGPSAPVSTRVGDLGGPEDGFRRLPLPFGRVPRFRRRRSSRVSLGVGTGVGESGSYVDGRVTALGRPLWVDVGERPV